MCVRECVCVVGMRQAAMQLVDIAAMIFFPHKRP